MAKQILKLWLFYWVKEFAYVAQVANQAFDTCSDAHFSFAKAAGNM